MVRNKTHRRKMTDKELLASAWNELTGTPRAIHPGKPSSTRTAPFSAKWRGLCGRCSRRIDRGDEVRFHRDFSGVVHSGCRAPEVTVTKFVRSAVVKGTRDPTLCSDCNLVHAGECW